MKSRCLLALVGWVTIVGLAAACGSSDGDGAGGSAASATGGAGGTGASGDSSTDGTAGSSKGGTAGSATGGTAGSATGGTAGSATGGTAGGSTGGTAGGSTGGSSGYPAGWLYTVTGDSKVYVSDGQSGTVWTGRGVNIDDIFLCGYNYGLWMSNPDGAAAMQGVLSNLMTEWKPTFLRVSLGMNSYDPVVSWLGSSTYKTAMTDLINAVGTHPGVYILVTLRSDTSMVTQNGEVCGQGDDAVCLPSPTTDDVYKALVTSFKDAPFVLFGIANEPGGMSASDQDISDRMSHAVGVIRAQEDALGVPHHIVSVQGNQWTSKIGFYNTSPLANDNVVYEYHSYPPEATGTYGYTQSSIPVIIGEYGPSGNDISFLSAFHADVESKHIPNLAWSVSPYSNCSPDMVQVTHSTTLTPTPWGEAVKTYLLAH